jgi:hypothetical protein
VFEFDAFDQVPYDLPPKRITAFVGEMGFPFETLSEIPRKRPRNPYYRLPFRRPSFFALKPQRDCNRSRTHGTLVADVLFVIIIRSLI